jgi:hypothetical protein
MPYKDILRFRRAYRISGFLLSAALLWSGALSAHAENGSDKIPGTTTVPTEAANSVSEWIVYNVSRFNSRCLADYKLDPAHLYKFPFLKDIIYTKDKPVTDPTGDIDKPGDQFTWYGFPGAQDKAVHYYFVGDKGFDGLIGELRNFAVNDRNNNIGDYQSRWNTPAAVFGTAVVSKAELDAPTSDGHSLIQGKVSDITGTGQSAQMAAGLLSLGDVLSDVPYTVTDASMANGDRVAVSIDCSKAGELRLNSKSSVPIPFLEVKYLFENTYNNKSGRKIGIVGFNFTSKASAYGLVQSVNPTVLPENAQDIYFKVWWWYVGNAGISDPVYIPKAIKGLHVFEYVDSNGTGNLTFNTKTSAGSEANGAGLGGSVEMGNVQNYRFERSEFMLIGDQTKSVQYQRLISANDLRDKIGERIEAILVTDDANAKANGILQMGDAPITVTRTYGLSGVPTAFCSNEYFSAVAFTEKAQIDIKDIENVATYRLSPTQDDKRFGCKISLSYLANPPEIGSTSSVTLQLKSADRFSVNKLSLETKLGSINLQRKAKTTAG